MLIGSKQLTALGDVQMVRIRCSLTSTHYRLCCIVLSVKLHVSTNFFAHFNAKCAVCKWQWATAPFFCDIFATVFSKMHHRLHSTPLPLSCWMGVAYFLYLFFVWCLDFSPSLRLLWCNIDGSTPTLKIVPAPLFRTYHNKTQGSQDEGAGHTSLPLLWNYQMFCIFRGGPLHNGTPSGPHAQIYCFTDICI